MQLAAGCYLSAWPTHSASAPTAITLHKHIYSVMACRGLGNPLHMHGYITEGAWQILTQSNHLIQDVTPGYCVKLYSHDQKRKKSRCAH